MRTLIAQIEKDLEAIDELTARCREALEQFTHRTPSFLEINGMAVILHNFYTAAETIFERIAIDLNGELPRGGDSHRQLLQQMMLDIPDVRPPVIERSIESQLDELRRFRHRFRHAYGSELEWEKLQPLMRQLPNIHLVFSKNLHQFILFLRRLTDGLAN